MQVDEKEAVCFSYKFRRKVVEPRTLSPKPENPKALKPPKPVELGVQGLGGALQATVLRFSHAKVRDGNATPRFQEDWKAYQSLRERIGKP